MCRLIMRLSSNPIEEKVCFRSNINRAGKERRKRIAIGLLVAFGLFIGLSRRLFPLSLLFTFLGSLPFSVGALFTFLEVTRQTCVLLSAKGIRESDGEKKFERVKDESEAEATRRVVKTIWRDSLIIGAGVAFVASYVAVSIF